MDPRPRVPAHCDRCACSNGSGRCHGRHHAAPARPPFPSAAPRFGRGSDRARESCAALAAGCPARARAHPPFAAWRPGTRLEPRTGDRLGRGRPSAGQAIARETGACARGLPAPGPVRLSGRARGQPLAVPRVRAGAVPQAARTARLRATHRSASASPRHRSRAAPSDALARRASPRARCSRPSCSNRSNR